MTFNPLRVLPSALSGSRHMIHRRSFLVGIAMSLVAAPAIVRAASIMPVRAVDTGVGFTSMPLEEYEAVVRERYLFSDVFRAISLNLSAAAVTSCKRNYLLALSTTHRDTLLSH